ncbi:hypothetical protein [Chondromyces crocatus]|uniref:Secreted protein n=1 Tax=Chondromyces crocatus TaxID=52 RepID=A0A0K1EHZ1_CHOCO|nr:hypothetical protein [Chondromyces crocatus]AKT40198.1 uncharacterized protein CMC5_043510 [Chondromyces crocatus]
MRPNRALLAAAAVAVGGLAVTSARAAVPTPPPQPEAPAPASTGRHCLEETRTKIGMGHNLGGAINPLGAEQMLSLYLCVPLIREPGLFFDLTNVQVGLVNYLSPAYVHQGGYVEITPLSPLVLRAELTGVAMWPFPVRGAGYFAYDGYEDDFQESTRPTDIARSAGGMIVTLSATLRARIGSPRGPGLIVVDTFIADRWSVGDESFSYNMRRDLIVAQQDWVIRNTGALIGEFPVTPDTSLRVGASDWLTTAPASGRVTNVLFGLASVRFLRVTPTVREVSPFVLMGAYTHHASSSQFRTAEPILMLGASASYELASFGP